MKRMSNKIYKNIHILKTSHLMKYLPHQNELEIAYKLQKKKPLRSFFKL